MASRPARKSVMQKTQFGQTLASFSPWIAAILSIKAAERRQIEAGVVVLRTGNEKA